jgi:hypothetical protein
MRRLGAACVLGSCLEHRARSFAFCSADSGGAKPPSWRMYSSRRCLYLSSRRCSASVISRLVIGPLHRVDLVPAGSSTNEQTRIPRSRCLAWDRRWDIESGGLDLEHRSQGDGWQQFTDAGLPRDGGMADLLREAASPAPKFAAVVCEDIERSGRDMFNALKLEKELSRQGIPLFATDEPAARRVGVPVRLPASPRDRKWVR